MRISSIQITNLCAFKDFKTQFGAVNILEGKHGAGKSSLERILMYALGRRPLAEKGSRAVQHDPAMLHGGADKGDAVINFDADSSVEYLRVLVKADATRREVKTRGSKRWEDAGLVIDDITNALAYDPMAFKDLNEKDRLEAFLRVVPVEITREEISVASGRPLIEIPDKPGLDTINQVYDHIYTERTKENVAADTQAKHADQLEAALPPTVEGNDWNAEVSRLRSEKTVIETSEAEEIKRITAEFQKRKDVAALVRQNTEGVIHKTLFAALEEIEAKIRELENQKATLQSEASAAKAQAIEVESAANEASRSVASGEAKEIRDGNAPLHAKLLTDIATADERTRGAAQAEGTRKAAKVAREEAEARKAKSKAMTEALTRLTALKAAVGSRMRIKGVTVASPREGMPVDICREENGALVPFSIWNDADKDQFCLKIAVLYRGPFGLVCVDNMGNWSAARRTAVIAICKRYSETEKMQFLLGLATDNDELKVVEA